jgi:F-type H+-transporting ATPase subunit b
MLIDWFTVAAQIVNFLVLVWLLKHFLYRRILRAMEERERRIAERLAEAEAKQKAAGEQLTLYQAKLRELDEQRESLLADIRLDAEKQHTEMLEKAREQVCSIETDWEEALDRERNAFLADLRRRAAAEILALARRTVTDLACVDIQRCAVLVFLEKIRLLDRAATKCLVPGELSVRTAFDLSDELQTEIQRVLQARIGTPVNLRFERVPGVGLGIELRGNGWRIGWNSETYLETLEADLREAFENRSAGLQEHRFAARAHAGST